MPYPQNVETAIQVEQLIRRHGAEPATIAIMDGRAQIGLDEEQLERLGKHGAEWATKTSRRDIANQLYRTRIDSKAMGATTVSGTMALAHLAGIDVFVTGGIGGVHRDGESTMDVSADLSELGKTPVAVVCAGVKSILDIGRTLEYLETQGVPVATIGKEYFPSFYTPSSPYKSPIQLGTATDAAELIAAQKAIGIKTGMVFACPIPSIHAQDASFIQSAIEQALNEMNDLKISGKEATPFLLKRVAELTKGKSLKSSMIITLSVICLLSREL